MVTRIDSHVFKIAVPLTKTGDETDGADWNKLVDEVGQVTKIVFADSPFTPLETDQLIECDCTGGVIIINLTSAATYDTKKYVIKKVDATANAVTVDPAGSETIDGSATVSLSSQWQVAGIESDGTNWLITTANSAGAGDITNAANVGTGTGSIFRDKSAGVLNIKTLKEGSNITIVNSADDITLSAVSLSAALSDLSDVTISGASTGQVLRKSAGDWVNSAIQASDVPAHSSSHGAAGSDPLPTTVITGQTEDTTPSAANDFVLTYDASATALKKVKLTNLPGGGSGTTITGMYNVDEVGSAVGDGSTDDTTAIQNTIDAAGAYGMPTLSSHSEYRIEDHLTMGSDGVWFNGQQGRLKLTTSMTADGMISLGTPGGGAATYIEQRVTNLGINFNSQTHGYGITNYDASGGASPVDAHWKGLIIEKIFFTGHATNGKSCIYLRNLENGCIIRDIRAESVVGSSGTPTSIIKIEDAGSGANHGNFVLDGGNHLSSSSSSTRFIECNGNAQFLNRVSIKGQWHCFYAASTAANLQRAVYFYVSSGNDLNNRGWELTGLHQEDTQFGVYVETSSGSVGLGGLSIHHNDFENKDPATDATYALASKGITFEGAGEIWGDIHNNTFLWGKSTSTGHYVGIDLTNLVVDSNHKLLIHDNFFYARAGATTSVPIRGVAGQSNVLIYNNPGYNPVGTITNPWKSTGLYNEVSGGSSAPTSATPYTVYNTRKRITISGGTVSQIQINSTTTGSTAGSFLLEPGDTIKITFSVVPTTSTVYCY